MSAAGPCFSAVSSASRRAARGAEHQLLIGDDGIWLHFDDNDAQYLQRFDEDGASGFKIGLPHEVQPVFVSATHVWYSDADWLIDTSYLMRAEQFALDDY
jgi:hypothetical protein